MANSKFRKAVLHSLSTREKAIIHGFYGMSYAELLTYYADGLEGLLKDTAMGKTRLNTRPYQVDNVTYRKDKIRSGAAIKGFVTPLPAGAGKTEIFFQTLIRTAKEVTVDGHGGKVKLITPPGAIIVPSVDMLDQVYNELVERYPNLVVGRRGGGYNEVQPLTVYVIDSFMLDMKSNFLHPNDIRLLVLDEAHRGLSQSGERPDELRKFIGISLFDAYSASPVFTNRRKDDPNRGVYNLLGEDSVIPSPSNRQITDMGHLAECHSITLTIKLESKDIPPEILNDEELFHDMITKLKVHAAWEFTSTYKDGETGQTALGKPFIGFTRFTRDAEYAANYFGERLAEAAADDAGARQKLAGYTHYTQVLSRSKGDRSVGEAFARLLPPDRVAPEYRKDPPETALGTVTSRMAREGTNVPKWKYAIRFHVDPIVGAIQGPGRVRRKVGDELSIVLDCLVELDGKILGKNPCLYHVAIDDPSVVRGAVTVVLPPEDVEELGSEVLEFKGKEEFKRLVLGEGSAYEKLGGKFDRLWGVIERHTFHHAAKPVPYVLDGDPVKCKLVTSYKKDTEGEEVEGKGKKEFRVSVSAIDQFRRELAIPGQTSSLWLDADRLEAKVLGKSDGVTARYYGTAYGTMATPAFVHVARNTAGAAHYPNPQIGGVQVRGEMRLDGDGHLVPAIHASGVQVIKEKLDILPYKTRKFLNREEFEALVFRGVNERAPYQAGFDTTWAAAAAYCRKEHMPGQQLKYAVDGVRVLVSDCINDESEKVFCIERKGVRAFQRLLGMPEIEFNVDGIEHDKDVSAVEKIVKKIDGYPNRTKEWIVQTDLKDKKGYSLDLIDALAEIVRKFNEGGQEPGIREIKHEKTGIAVHMQIMLSGTNNSICFLEKDIKLLIGKCNLQDRDSSFISRKYTKNNKIMGGSDIVQTALLTIESDFNKGLGRKIENDVVIIIYQDVEMHVKRVKSSSNKVVCFQETGVDSLIEKLTGKKQNKEKKGGLPGDNEEKRESAPKEDKGNSRDGLKKPRPTEKKDTSPGGKHTKDRSGFGSTGKGKGSGES